MRQEEHDIDEHTSASLVPSQSVNNTRKSAFKYLPSTDWLINLLYISRTFESSNTSYAQGMDIYLEFCFQLYLDKAVQLLHKIPFNHSNGSISSSGCLVKIDKCKASWHNKIQNYFFLLKDLRFMDEPAKFRSLLLNEMISSSHGTSSISSMIRKV